MNCHRIMALRDSVTTEQGAAHSAGPLALDVSTSVSPSPGREVVEGLMKRLGCVRVYEHIIYVCVCISLCMCLCIKIRWFASVHLWMGHLFGTRNFNIAMARWLMIYSWFTYYKRRFSIAMLNYQREIIMFIHVPWYSDMPIKKQMLKSLKSSFFMVPPPKKIALHAHIHRLRSKLVLCQGPFLGLPPRFEGKIHGKIHGKP